MTRLYFADVTPLADPTLYARYYADLSAYRKRKVDRLAGAGDRRLSLGVGALLAYGLRDRYGLTEREMTYAENEYGKPYFTNHNEIKFSVSHSGRLALVAFSDREVGCDVEETRTVSPGLAGRYFTPAEAERCAGDPDAFISLWTVKEAVVKAVGRGFSLPFSSFETVPCDDGTTQARLGDGRCFVCTPLSVPAGYRAALCTPQEVGFCLTVVDLTQKTGDTI